MTPRRVFVTVPTAVAGVPPANPDTYRSCLKVYARTLTDPVTSGLGGPLVGLAIN
jgi:hypothetical protein